MSASPNPEICPDIQSVNAWDAQPFLEKVTGLVPSIIYVFNQQTQSNEYSNRSLGEALGYTNEEVMGMGAALIPTLCHPDDLESVGAHFVAVNRLQDEEVSQIEYRMKHKNGHWVWLLSHDSVFERDETGNVLRHLGVATDISAQKNSEHTALVEKENADVVNEELSAFAYAMSHDMKAPSNTMQLLLSELLENHNEDMPADARELIEMALKTVGHMSSLVDNILHYTTVIGQPLAQETIEMNTLVTEVLDYLMADIRASFAQISIGPLPRVMGSQMQVHMLFQNLIANALKFKHSDSVPIIKIKEVRSEDPNFCAISVKDDGIGISPEQHQNIFGIFKRLNKKTSYEGSGLGLAICKRIVSNLGGSINVSSQEDRGATFTVILPKP